MSGQSAFWEGIIATQPPLPPQTKMYSQPGHLARRLDLRPGAAQHADAAVGQGQGGGRRDGARGGRSPPGPMLRFKGSVSAGIALQGASSIGPADPGAAHVCGSSPLECG